MKPENPNVLPDYKGDMSAIHYHPIGGMTLRDYFAAHAPEPSRQDIELIYPDTIGKGMDTVLQRRTELRYKYADAMLKFRLNKTP